MKKIMNSVLILFAVFLFSSCLNSGLEDLPEYSDALISSVSRVEHRYISDEVSNASGQPIVKFATLTHKSNIDKEAGTVLITVTVPDGFPTAQKSKISTKALVVSLNLSTAARIAPIEGSAALGVPADWSKANKYRVTAADGTKKDWSVSLTFTE